VMMQMEHNTMQLQGTRISMMRTSTLLGVRQA
jgi:hypothetical protein